MKDGVTELIAIAIALIVLIFVPMVLTVAEGKVRRESEAGKAIYNTLEEINRDGIMTKAEMEHILRVASTQKQPLHLGFYTMEGTHNGSFGDYLYKAEESRIFELLEKDDRIVLPEGGIIGVYR